ncbi:hypothetical protein F5X96DRAFT_680150 [Biscogniauxia mediterranea]|nr:hypothetical protein F5X96DRAFT_680150 [Biscogniauxia mediterranea]
MSPVTQTIIPTSSPAASSPEYTSNMTKPNTEASKVGKRKGTRSVSTLSPSQLARKRANDREAQRAIRARTKEHIENLEREIEELRSRQNRDQTIQELLRRNKALEEEVHRLREGMGIRSSAANDHYHSSMFWNPVRCPSESSKTDRFIAYHNSSARASPFGHSTPEYPIVSDMSPYSNIPDTTDAWPSSVPCSVPSTVSSPSSSGAPDDYGYLPTSAPSSAVLERTSLPPNMGSPAASCIGSDMGFDDIKSEYGCPPLNLVPLTPTTYHQQPWNVYPVYYQASPVML